MAVDKKSQHVGNHGGTYTDMEGMSRQFTYIDHDKKTITPSFTESPEENWQRKYRASLIERIIGISASLCPDIFMDYTVRGDNKMIEWNTDMLLDEGLNVMQLRDIAVLTENRASFKINYTN